MTSITIVGTGTGTLTAGSVVSIEYAGHSVPGDNPQAFQDAVSEFMRGIELGTN